MAELSKLANAAKVVLVIVLKVTNVLKVAKLPNGQSNIVITQDGLITMGEVLARNLIIDGFNSFDLNKDGIIVPAEIDSSLVIL